MLYALVNNADEIIRYEHFEEFPGFLAAQKGLRWLAVKDEAPALFNPATQKRGAPVITVTPDGVTRKVNVTPKTGADREAERGAHAQRMETDPVLAAIIRQMAADKGIAEGAMRALIAGKIE